MATEQLAAALAPPDPSSWVDRHGDCLFRYAMFRLHDAAAEDAVQETLLAALQAYHTFAGRGSERTWLVGILKHHECFRSEGEWVGHWEADKAPAEWRANPEELFEQDEFYEVLSRCLAPLPERIRATFTLREVDGLTSEEICELLGVSPNNLWVMLHRARMHLRRCIELNWFRPHGN